MAPTNKKSSSSPSKNRSSSSNTMTLRKVKGENFYRNAKQVSRLKMYNGGKPVYDRDGKIIQAAAFQKTEAETKPGRVQPDRRWFGNTRVITQTALDHFRTNLSTKVHDPYSVLLRSNKLPMALLDDAANPHTRKRSHIVETEPFKETFGPKAQRKKPRLDVSTFEELSKASAEASINAEAGATGGEASSGDMETSPAEPDSHIQTHNDYIQPIFSKGTSRRIYGELYKVIDSSDVILHVLDARDPLGTMCESVLGYVRKEKAHKQVVLIINKCDLVPNWVTARYVQHLTPRYPTIAFHASPNHSFGKGSLIQLLRQFSQLHSDRRQISVGFIGYPNVGKSSVINTLSSGKVCTVAPVPGETKVWQYITLTKRIYLIDCPGIVPTSAHDTQTSTVLKGVIRIEALPTPSEHIPALLARVKPLYISRTYNIPLPDPADPTQTWQADELLDKLARMKGRLLKGGEPDMDGVAKIVLGDWVRGRIPYFVMPPERPTELNEVEEKERARERQKGKGKVDAKEKGKGRQKTLGVMQKLGGILQKNTYVGDDVRPIEEERGDATVEVEGDDNDAAESTSIEGEGDVAEEANAPVEWTGFGENDDGQEEGNEADGHENEETELKWDDVFFDETKTGTEKVDVIGVNASSESESESSPISADDDEREIDADANGRRKAKKEARMTTNKRKPTNFFSTTNVKNKNRSKRQPQRPGNRPKTKS